MTDNKKTLNLYLDANLDGRYLKGIEALCKHAKNKGVFDNIVNVIPKIIYYERTGTYLFENSQNKDYSSIKTDYAKVYSKKSNNNHDFYNINDYDKDFFAGDYSKTFQFIDATYTILNIAGYAKEVMPQHTQFTDQLTSMFNRIQKEEYFPGTEKELGDKLHKLRKNALKNKDLIELHHVKNNGINVKLSKNP